MEEALGCQAKQYSLSTLHSTLIRENESKEPHSRSHGDTFYKGWLKRQGRCALTQNVKGLGARVHLHVSSSTFPPSTFHGSQVIEEHHPATGNIPFRVESSNGKKRIQRLLKLS